MNRRIGRGAFLPVSRKDMEERGWKELDFLVVSGDAYVDHPSFGHAIIARVLEREGYRVGILAQPDYRSPEAFLAMGRPRLGVLVSAGNLDSMLNAFTAAKKRRHTDSYSPGNRAGRRPERATIVYCNRVRQAMGNVPVVIGGIEASLRRFAHYDYWDDAVRRSILVDSGADLLVFGMGELQVLEIARQLALGIRPGDIRDVAGTCWMASERDEVWKESVELPSFEAVLESKTAFAEAFRLFYLEQDPIRGKTLLQLHGSRWVVQNPPARPLTTEQLDSIYELPYTRSAHPDYDAEGGVPAIQEVQFSLVSHRGCFGSCSFCAITSHQGRIIQSRSRESLVEEAALLTRLPNFKGYIHDVGGPTANFRHPSCEGQLERGTCRGRECLGSKPCPSLNADHSEYLDILRAVRSVPRVKKVFVRSGIRYDYLLAGGP
ncbi:MAG: YgiQ family radical SAM protein, partial [Synergistaceae bacterium]|nr:YgiQ family radical SAM protein [Synergistaceae bacterium]